MDWIKLVTHTLFVIVIGPCVSALIAAWYFSRRHPEKAVPTTEEGKCEWFEVESVEDLGRKIHAGIVLLNRQARSGRWDARQKDAFIRASRQIEAAHYEVTRLARN